MLWQRVLSAAVGIPVLLALVYLGGWYLGAAVLVLSLVGMHEFFRLAEGSGLRPARAMGYAAAVVVTAAVTLGGEAGPAGRVELPEVGELVALVLVVVGIAAILQQVLWPSAPGAAANAGATLFGVVYLPLMLSYLVRLREVGTKVIPLGGGGWAAESGALWVALLMFACWAEDTAAYFVGRAIGRHKLCPRISPGKTIEGAVAGLAAAVMVAAALGRWLGLPLSHGLALGALIGVFGQLGDLSKSVLKREAGVKDAGALIPGHGGVLDRFDSLLFAAPVTFYYLAEASARLAL